MFERDACGNNKPAEMQRANTIQQSRLTCRADLRLPAGDCKVQTLSVAKNRIESPLAQALAESMRGHGCIQV